MNLQFLIKILLTQLISLLPKEWQEDAINKLTDILREFAKDKIDAFLDWVETSVLITTNTWDDNLIGVCLWIRNLLGVPDFDLKEVKEEVKEASGILQKVSVYPEPYAKMKSELYVLENMRTNQLIPGYSFAGYLDGDTYYFKTKWK